MSYITVSELFQFIIMLTAVATFIYMVTKDHYNKKK